MSGGVLRCVVVLRIGWVALRKQRTTAFRCSAGLIAWQSHARVSALCSGITCESGRATAGALHGRAMQRERERQNAAMQRGRDADCLSRRLLKQKHPPPPCGGVQLPCTMTPRSVVRRGRELGCPLCVASQRRKKTPHERKLDFGGLFSRVLMGQTSRHLKEAEIDRPAREELMVDRSKQLLTCQVRFSALLGKSLLAVTLFVSVRYVDFGLSFHEALSSSAPVIYDVFGAEAACRR